VKSGSFLLLLAMSAVAAVPALADKGVIVAECRSRLLVDATLGYAILEWYGGNSPSKGETVVGEFDHYGMKDIYNISQDASARVWVDDFWLSEQTAMEKFFAKCR
jgi:hypothetical protein